MIPMDIKKHLSWTQR